MDIPADDFPPAVDGVLIAIAALTVCWWLRWNVKLYGWRPSDWPPLSWLKRRIPPA
jgi:hypothetical protein